MASGLLIICLAYFQVAHSQYYSVPPSYPAYNYNYYPQTIPAAPAFGPTLASVPPPPLKTPKRSVPPATPKISPPTASAYFLTTPSNKVKATILPKEKITGDTITPTYSCPLCNGFADLPPNPKLTPPPSRSPVLPGIINEIPTIVIPKDLSVIDKDVTSLVKDAILLPESPLFSDMYEKHKLPKNLSFDQELLEGFLTGLGLDL